MLSVTTYNRIHFKMPHTRTINSRGGLDVEPMRTKNMAKTDLELMLTNIARTEFRSLTEK